MGKLIVYLAAVGLLVGCNQVRNINPSLEPVSVTKCTYQGRVTASWSQVLWDKTAHVYSYIGANCHVLRDEHIVITAVPYLYKWSETNQRWWEVTQQGWGTRNTDSHAIERDGYINLEVRASRSFTCGGVGGVAGTYFGRVIIKWKPRSSINVTDPIGGSTYYDTPKVRFLNC